MSKEKLQTYNFVCIIVAIVAAVAEFVVITMITFSAHNTTFLSNAPDIVIKALAYTPWVLLCVAILLKLHFTSEIKKIELRNEAEKTENRIKELERQVAQLKKK